MESFSALLTARGRGAVATVGFCGDLSRIDAAGMFRAANGKGIADQSLDRIAFGHWGHDPAEEVVVCRVAADRAEIHCHGGDVAAERIQTHLEEVGAARFDGWEFIERIEGRFSAEIAKGLTTAATARTAAFVARQADGPLRESLERLSHVDPIADRTTAIAQIDGLLQWKEFGMHLTQPWQVVLYGRPNVGKSSLINALVGFERAIVFDRPGTTRDVVTAETAFDGWPVRLSDTAGLRDAAEELEAAGIERARRALAEADLRVLVLDRSGRAIDELTEGGNVQPHLVVANKTDLADAWGHGLPAGAIPVSARTGHGIRDLIGKMTAALVSQVPGADEPVPVTPGQIEALELAREALIRGEEEGFHTAFRGVWP